MASFRQKSRRLKRLTPTEREGKSRIPKVALLIETSNAFARGVLAGIEDYIRAYGPWNVYLAEHGRGDRPPAWLLNWAGDGIIARIENHRIASDLEKVRIPIVDVSAPRLFRRAPTVTTDNAMIASVAVQHFLERGFERFAFCGNARFSWSVSRGEHFMGLLHDHGFSCNEFAAPKTTGADSDTEIDSIAGWLLRLPKPVAVFACYDQRGQQVLNACRRADLAVPEEVAVLGVDNDEVLCQLSPPPLSSIILNSHRGGWEAAELLARMMRGEELSTAPVFIPPVGVAARQSTDVTAVEDPHVARAARFIRENACERISVRDVVAAVPLARRLLERRFRAMLGHTLREEITRVQIQRVKELLAGTELSLAEIAERTGFKHVEYMTVVFKRECGQPPSIFRAENQPKAR